MKIEIELFRYSTLVFGKVLKQSENLRGTGLLAEIDEFTVKSEGAPELKRCGLYVNGNLSHNDGREFSRTYDTEEEAIDICDKIKKCIDKINEKPVIQDIKGVEKIL